MAPGGRHPAFPSDQQLGGDITPCLPVTRGWREAGQCSLIQCVWRLQNHPPHPPPLTPPLLQEENRGTSHFTEHVGRRPQSPAQPALPAPLPQPSPQAPLGCTAHPPQPPPALSEDPPSRIFPTPSQALGEDKERGLRGTTPAHTCVPDFQPPEQVRYIGSPLVCGVLYNRDSGVYTPTSRAPLFTVATEWKRPECISRRMDKQTMVHPYDEVSFSLNVLCETRQTQKATSKKSTATGGRPLVVAGGQGRAVGSPMGSGRQDTFWN